MQKKLNLKKNFVDFKRNFLMWNFILSKFFQVMETCHIDHIKRLLTSILIIISDLYNVFRCILKNRGLNEKKEFDREIFCAAESYNLLFRKISSVSDLFSVRLSNGLEKIKSSWLFHILHSRTKKRQFFYLSLLSSFWEMICRHLQF